MYKHFNHATKIVIYSYIGICSKTFCKYSIIIYLATKTEKQMKINRDPNQAPHYFSNNGSVLRTYGDFGVNDSLGRTVFALEIYDEDWEDLTYGVAGFFNFIDSTYYVSRYPSINEEPYLIGTSRDHIIKAIAVMKERRYELFVKDFLLHKSRRPGIDMPYTIGQKVWFRALYSHFWSYIYAIGRTPWLLLTLGVCRILRFIGGYKTYDTPQEFADAHVKPTKLQKVFNYVMTPTFSVFYELYATRTLHNKGVSRFLLRIMRHFFEKTNYVARAMCGDDIDPYVFEIYNPTRKGRWSCRLDATNDRDMQTYFYDRVENNVELGMLWKYTK